MVPTRAQRISGAGCVEDSTDAEIKLWLELRDRRVAGFKFNRQVRIGPYIADFVCRERKLVVELDGGQHLDSPRDKIRNEFLAQKGYRVARFWNNDVFANRDGVLETILSLLGIDEFELAPHPASAALRPPSPR